MTDQVPVLSMVFMTVTAVFAFAIPVFLLIWYRKKKQASVVPFFIGCAVMLIFALTLESLVHTVVFLTPGGRKIQSNIWLYALYGGLMAGLFEESGRWIAFRTVLKRWSGNDANALMYGAGHGGFEAAALVGTSMISNLVLSLMINTGAMNLITDQLGGDVLTQINAAVKILVTTSPYLFLASLAERVSAIILHIALSVLVWFSVKKKKFSLLLTAFTIHFAVDFVTAALAGLGTHTAIMEVAIAVMSLAAAFLSKRVWDKEKTVLE